MWDTHTHRRTHTHNTQDTHTHTRFNNPPTHDKTFVVTEDQVNAPKQKLRTHAHTRAHTFIHARILNDDVVDANDLSGISIMKA